MVDLGRFDLVNYLIHIASGLPTWLEVVALDLAGKPFKGKFKIEVPDGQIKEGSFGASGKIRLQDLEPGSTEVRLPDLGQEKTNSAT